MYQKIKSTHRITIVIVSLVAVFLPIFLSSVRSIPVTGQFEAQAAAVNALPDFDTFVAAVVNGDSSVVRGVYAPGVLALRVQQQPTDNAEYVPSIAGLAAQFNYAAKSGITGLIAHNFLSGDLFFDLVIGQEMLVVYGDGSIQRYIVRQMQRYQALSPDSPYSDFVDLDSNMTISSTDLFNRVYTGAHHLTLQTCIANNGNLTWGRLFVIAEPIES